MSLLYSQYNAENPGKYGGEGEYTVQSGFGWTNGVIMQLLNTYGSVLTSEKKNHTYCNCKRHRHNEVTTLLACVTQTPVTSVCCTCTKFVTTDTVSMSKSYSHIAKTWWRVSHTDWNKSLNTPVVIFLC